MNNQPLLQDNRNIDNIRVEIYGYKTIQEFLQEIQLVGQVEGEEIAQYIYFFKVILKNKSWILRKRVIDFVDLEKEMRHDPFLLFKHKEISKENAMDDPKQVQVVLFNYLKNLLNSVGHQQARIELLQFLEISDVCLGDAKKYKECILKKKAGGRFSESRCARCGTLWGRWSKRYFCITNHGVMYSKKGYGQEAKIRETLIFDVNFKQLIGLQETGHQRGIILQFSTRHLVLNAPDLFTFIDFIASLKQAIHNSPYMQSQRFDSFAPIRQSQCKWYIDGEDYFNDVMQAILSAKTTVMITDWWLSPDMFLKRPINVDDENLKNRESRLDVILKNVADRGVSVLILVYQEPTLALNNDSLHTKQFLEQQSRNISVMRHPSQIIPQQWSHHEKMVVIDNEIGFMGGLDLCFGRMDNQQHNLKDLEDGSWQFWPGIDYANNRQKDFVNVKQSNQCLIKRTDVRMPWHDIAIKIVGGSVSDLARHFVQYWNHVIIEQDFEGRKQQRQVLQGVGQQQFKVEDSFRQSVAIKIQQNTHFQKYLKQVEQEQTIQQPDKRRISAIYQNDTQLNKDMLTILQDIQIDDDNEEEVQQYERHHKITHQNSNHHILQFNAKEVNSGSCETQLLRSCSKWSIGCSSTNSEFSIHLAYLQLIDTAKNYIYIENQFFISNSADSKVLNKVAETLVKRIIRAAERGERFKVIVFLPLLPGFEGEIDSGTSAVMKVQLHWEYNTICRGGNSIIEQLQKCYHIRDPSDYIEFYSLRTHTFLQGPKTEQIYIHSKLMIIDDEIALIGSANINDRSLLGTRDSEIAIVVRDNQQVPSIMNGQKVMKAKFAQTLRISLYQEHFNLSEDKVIDPLSPQLQEIIRKQTRNNTLFYRQIFATYPDDTVKSLQQYPQFKTSNDLSLYDSYAHQIKGNAVEFPLEFLQDEDLRIKVFTKEYLVPDDNFT